MVSSLHVFPLIALILSLCVTQGYGVEWSKFKKCSDLGFCRRHRQFSALPHARYILNHQSITISTWKNHPAVTGILKAEGRADVLLVIISFANGLFRVVFDDVENPPHARHTVSDVIMPHVEPIVISESFISVTQSVVKLTLPNSSAFLKISCSPFRIDLLSTHSDIPRLTLNADDRLLIDQFETKPPPPPEPEPEPGTVNENENEKSTEEESKSNDGIDEENTESSEVSIKTEENVGSNNDSIETEEKPIDNCDGCWSEEFQSHTDPKLRGPESVGLDVTFPFASDIYGIPERTVKFSIDNTIDKDGNIISEPNRLYNLDVFEFELDKQLGLYGTVPFVYARNQKDTTGLLWLNSAETYVDLLASESGRKTHWYSESGLIDLFLFAGPSPKSIFDQYIWVTGRPAMPQRFSLGYHQCRWNYRDDDDVRMVDAAFDDHRIPYDVLWLDIEHTDGKRYFTWDTERFPDATVLQNHLASRGRKMVTIVDPHVKRDNQYSVHQLGTEQNMYVKKPDGSDYDGWCWPGSSSYFDCTSERVRTLIGSLFSPEKYPHFSKNLHIWNDMNEPSVFNGPEGTMPKDVLHENQKEHRHIHNIYGHYYMQSTFEGVRKGQGGNNRPFVLSRSFFAGSQRFGAVWTGDNTAGWDHLQSTVRMLLPMQICGIVFSGADVGGFFGNPDAELLTRWYQIGAFQPFFRGHAHLDTNRREPWLFGEPYTQIISTAIRARYELIPYWYTLFAGNALGSKVGLKSSSDGPPMRPMWWEFEQDKESLANEKQWMVGSALLVSPVMESGVTSHNVYLPEGEEWYDLYAPGEEGKRVGKSGEVEYSVNLERMMVFQRGGTIIGKQERQRRSTVAMGRDAFTLLVALDEKRQAEGEIYLDDGESYDFESGSFIVRRIEMKAGKVTGSIVSGNEDFTDVFIERVVILGYGSKAPMSVSEGDRNIDFVVNAKSGSLTLQRVNVSLVSGRWAIQITEA